MFCTRKSTTYRGVKNWLRTASSREFAGRRALAHRAPLVGGVEELVRPAERVGREPELGRPGIAEQRDELVERGSARRKGQKRVARVEERRRVGSELVAAEQEVTPIVVAQHRHDLAEVPEAAGLSTLGQRFGKEADRLGDPDRQQSVQVRECRLSQQAGNSVGRRLAERPHVVDDLTEVAARGPIAGVVGKGLLVLDGPVEVDAEASLGLGSEVGFEHRARANDEPLELRSLRGVEAGGRRSWSLQAHLLPSGGPVRRGRLAGCGRERCRAHPRW